MKKLLFLATFSFLFIQLAQAVVLPQTDFSKETILSESVTAAAAQIQVTFGNGGDLSNQSLLTNQQLSFTDASGATVSVDLQVQSSLTTGGVLNVVFNTATSLSGLSIENAQELDFVHAITGAATTVDFIVIDIIDH